MTEAIVTKVKALLVQNIDLNIDIDRVSVDMPLLDGDFGLDSIVIIDFIAKLEQEFKITFSDEELRPDEFRDINTISKMIASKLNANLESATAPPGVGRGTR